MSGNVSVDAQLRIRHAVITFSDTSILGDCSLRVLVLGGYGLIGAAVSNRLIFDGHNIVGLARSGDKGRALIPDAYWLEADISKLTKATDWYAHLDCIDVVVNASGALQNGLKDNVAAVQLQAILALIEACETKNVERFVQISAPGANEASDTLFFQTKGKADQALKASTLKWSILRPGLVIAPQAYGGTSLVRMLAAFPVVQPIVMADVPIQTVSVDDVSNAVSMAVTSDTDGIDLEVVEPHTRTLAELVLAVRLWLGFAPPRLVLSLPDGVGRIVARLADLAGWLGWRSALQTTSLTVLTKGVTGDSKQWEIASGQTAYTLEQTLKRMPSTVQERIYARVMLVFPIILFILSGFWIASGVVGLFQHSAAFAVVHGALPEPLAHVFIRSGSIIDILIGVMMLFRPTTRFACLASMFVALAYLAGGTVFTPELWSDPLGPLVKVIPAIGLALIVTALMQER